MTTRRSADKTYLDALTARLRWLDVPGPRIGEILAEVEAHVAATGETPKEAFGPPVEYARQWAPSPPRPYRPRSWLRLAGSCLVGAVVGFGLVEGAVDVGRGRPTLGVSAWWFVALALALMVATAATIPLGDDLVIDPRTREPRVPTRRAVLVATVGGTGLLFVAAFIGLGLLLG